MSPRAYQAPPKVRAAADLVRAMIASGELQPGDRVPPARIAALAGVCLEYARRALIELEREGVLCRPGMARSPLRVAQPHDSEADDRAPFPVDGWPYLVLAGRLEQRIRRGEFGEDGQLPATGELMTRYGQKAGVVRHAYKELMRRGLVRPRAGNGYFVRPGARR